MTAQTQKPVDASWKAVVLGEGNGFYLVVFVLFLALVVWLESARILAWWDAWWWAVILVAVGVVALTVWVFKRLSTPRFEDVPEPLLNTPWTGQPSSQPSSTTTTKGVRSMNQSRGTGTGTPGFGRARMTPRTPSMVPQDRSGAAGGAPVSRDPTPSKPRGFTGVHEALGETPPDKPAYRGPSGPRRAVKKDFARTSGSSSRGPSVPDGHFCPSCGKETPENYPYCRRCGKEIPE